MIFVVGFKCTIFIRNINKRCQYQAKRTGYATTAIFIQSINSWIDTRRFGSWYSFMYKWVSYNKVFCILSGKKSFIVPLVTLLDIKRYVIDKICFGKSINILVYFRCCTDSNAEFATLWRRI